MDCFRSLLSLGLLSASFAAAAPVASWQNDIRPMLQKYCWDCHGDGAKKGGVALDQFQSEADLVMARKTWDSVMFNLDNWLMPPARKDQPTPEERASLVHWIDDTVFPVDPAHPDPGRVTIRRLNKTEYHNTIRDLLGVEVPPADGFPDDDSGYGFDNIGDVLAMPPVLVERYLKAASQVLDAAIVPGGARFRDVVILPADLKAPAESGQLQGARFMLWSNGEAGFEHDFSAAADYTVRCRVHADQAGPEPVKMVLRVGDREIQRFDVTGTVGDPQTCEAKFRATRGRQAVGLAFINDFVEGEHDRNLYMERIEVIGPEWSTESPLPESHRRIFIQAKDTEGTEAATRQVLTAFVNRAYRRPVRAEELDKLAGLVARAQAAGDDWEESVKVALKASLVSPHFLYRIEGQPNPDDAHQVADLDEFALASRLSYFLWSSMPDERLFALALKHELRTGLAAEVKRLLADPKARSLARNFGGQWLEIRNLEIVQPNRKIYRGFDNELRTSMRRETEELFHYLLAGNRSVLEFLSADYTFVDERLARHYGIEGVKGGEFQRVNLDTSKRRGILTHAGILTVTSDPTRTSPVKRGKWVLENILGTPPPPPPPNVPTLEAGRQLTGSLRQRMEQHRANPACANCHALLDPIGFGLENFDGIGAWRDRDGEFPVESAGRLTTGQEFQTAGQLTDILLRDKVDPFVRTLTRKLLTFAIGRGTEYYDKPAIAAIMARAKEDHYAFQSLIEAVCESVPFQKRRGDGAR